MALNVHNAAFGLALAALAGAAAPGQAQQVLSAASSEPNPGGDAVTAVSTQAGVTVSTGTASEPSRVQTGYGVNKIFAASNGGFDQYAPSIWVDTYQVASTGAGPVNIALSFNFDGSAFLPTGGSGVYNFKIFALRGDDYVLSGRTSQTFATPNDAKLPGDQYDALLLTKTTPTLISQIDLREYDGVYNYANSSGAPGAFQSRINYFESDNYYEIVNANPTSRFYTDRREVLIPGVPVPFVTPYTPQNGLLNIRNALDQNFIVLDRVSLCDETSRGCTSDFSGTTSLSLNFNIAAGSTFTLASWLYADDLDQGTIDFFNTARLTSITASPGASLTSGSGTLQMLPGGGFGYPSAPTGAVPEPASWAMMIIGFGVVGAARRRRRQQLA